MRRYKVTLWSIISPFLFAAAVLAFILFAASVIGKH